MNLLHLQYFYVVASEQGFTKASKVLRVQQPAISRMVKQLEDNLDVQLFERQGRGIKLTSQGTKVFQWCKRIFTEVDAFKKELGYIRETCEGPLLFGAVDAIASHLIPNPLKKFLEQYPKIYPCLYSAPASVLIDKIEKGELEFGLFFHVAKIPTSLQLKVIAQVPFHLVIRKGLEKNKGVVESFIGSREIDDTGVRRFPTLERLRRDYPNAHIKISSNNLMAHKYMVLAGLGVSVLPQVTVADEIRKGELSVLYPREPLRFNLKLIKRSHGVLSSGALTFLNAVRFS